QRYLFPMLGRKALRNQRGRPDSASASLGSNPSPPANLLNKLHSTCPTFRRPCRHHVGTRRKINRPVSLEAVDAGPIGCFSKCCDIGPARGPKLQRHARSVEKIGCLTA